jgi:hypothetical protein
MLSILLNQLISSYGFFFEYKTRTKSVLFKNALLMLIEKTRFYHLRSLIITAVFLVVELVIMIDVVYPVVQLLINAHLLGLVVESKEFAAF